MDSSINRPLDELINEGDDAIITAEGNPDLFVQWALMFKAGHPILKIVIELVVDNIKNNKYPNDIHKMTGPSVFTQAIQIVHANTYSERINHVNIKQGTDITYDKNDVKYRILGIDYDGFLSCKIPECFSLFNGRKKWHHQQKITPLLNDF